MGTLTFWNNTWIYDGNWSKNLKHGHGNLIMPELKYVGFFALYILLVTNFKD